MASARELKLLKVLKSTSLFRESSNFGYKKQSGQGTFGC